ncbi:hypothetical protein BGZ94_008968 [Podila epigama]|nr:hypothetical protein BGZ94_008968 [Podila epigama]
MPLAQESIESILIYLDPHLDTLQTGFPTSTRPNETPLTREQKRSKIETTLSTNPGIFLTRWGSVILYPRPETSTNSVNVDSSISPAEMSPQDILDLFLPLQADYEVKYQLESLYRQLQQLNEHRQYIARQKMTPSTTSSHDTNSTHRSQQPHLQSNQESDIAGEDRKPELGQHDLFNQSALSEKTRRNRRLNYLLRHLAPPTSSESSAYKAPPPPPPNRSRSHQSNGYSSFESQQQQQQQKQQHPSVASILSISGSMSNLSFSESTYFSDAEMEARAPDLYQQYIGRFMDNDDDDVVNEDEESDADEGPRRSSGAGGKNKAKEDPDQDADDEREESVEPFSDDMGLVDRILWNIDHPSKYQLKRERQEAKDRRQEYHESGSAFVQRKETEQQHAYSTQRHEEDKDEEEEEFEEEFDTESEVDDLEMVAADDSRTFDVAVATKGDASEQGEVQKQKGPLANVDDDEIRQRISVTPRIPSESTAHPEFLSSAMASAAISMEQPEERAKFAEVENGNDDSELGETMDKATEERKEDQEALRREFVLLMKQRFLDGLDTNFDYSTVDFDEDLDDLEQEAHDEEDRYFDSEDEFDEEKDATLRTEGPKEHQDNRNLVMDLDGSLVSTKLKSQEDGSRQRSLHPYASRHGVSVGMSYDERLRSWGNSAQNGAGDYDY